MNIRSTIPKPQDTPQGGDTRYASCTPKGFKLIILFDPHYGQDGRKHYKQRYNPLRGVHGNFPGKSSSWSQKSIPTVRSSLLSPSYYLYVHIDASQEFCISASVCTYTYLSLLKKLLIWYFLDRLSIDRKIIFTSLHR